MERIRIKRKTRRSGWGWIIGLLIVIGTLWLIMEFVADDNVRPDVAEEINRWSEESNPYGNENEETGRTVDIIDAYIVFVNRDFRNDSINKSSVKEGMQRLTTVIGEVIKTMGADGRELVENQNRLKQQVESAQNPVATDSTVSAESGQEFNQSFATAANILIILQRQEYPELDAVGKAMASSADKIQPEANLQEQSQHVRDFFFATAGALETMKQRLHEELSYLKY